MDREERKREIIEHPERHRHSFSELQRCCMVEGGALDMGLVEAHSTAAPLGRNGGIACDVTDGPCACGAWH